LFERWLCLPAVEEILMAEEGIFEEVGGALGFIVNCFHFKLLFSALYGLLSSSLLFS